MFFAERDTMLLSICWLSSARFFTAEAELLFNLLKAPQGLLVQVVHNCGLAGRRGKV